jgi:hypothetical protein
VGSLNYMKRLLVLPVVAFLVIVGTAQARLMPPFLAQTKIKADGRNSVAKKFKGISEVWVEKCGTAGSLRRYECLVQMDNREPIGRDAEGDPIHEIHHCTWTAIARWRGKVVVVKRRELECEQFEEGSR